MFQEKLRDKHGFLVAKQEIKKVTEDRALEAFEKREWSPSIADKLLMTPPKFDKDGYPIEGSERIEQTGENAHRIMVLDERMSNRLGYDEALRSVVIRDEIPWEIRRTVKWGEIPRLYDEKPWRPLTENDVSMIMGFLATHYRIKLMFNDLRRWIDLASQVNRFHSIQDWLKSLTWDGTPRIHDWLIRLCQAEDNALNRAYCPRILQSAVARAFEPGCKVDTMPGLLGKQGGGKSSLWLALAGTLNGRRLHVVFNEKIGSDNGTRVLHSSWFTDLDECGALKRCRDPEIPKQWITKSEDAIIQKYKNEVERWPRSSILVCSANPGDIIKDPAGARRYWVIKVGTVDLRGIAREREQLWAEAVVRYRAWQQANLEFIACDADPDILPGVYAEMEERAKELHWSLPPDLWEVQADSVSNYTNELDYEGQIAAFLKENNIERISTTDVIKRCLRYTSEPQRGDAEAVSLVMYRLGWEKVRYRENGVQARGWERPKG